MEFFKAVYILFVGVVVFFLAYVVTRFVGKQQAQKLKGRNIQVMESSQLGFDKLLHLVKIGNQYFLISSSGKNISFLSQVEPSNINLENEVQEQPVMNIGSFTRYFDIFKKKSNSPVRKEPIIKDIETNDSEHLDASKKLDRVRQMFDNING